MKLKCSWQEFINDFEIRIGTVIFMIVTILLTIQVFTRYTGHALTWTEELAIPLFVWMSYLGFSGAITKRKNLKVDFFIEMMPFIWKKGFLIFSNICNALFCGFLIRPMILIITNLAKSNNVTPMLRMPKAVIYAIMPFSMVLMIIRTIQECRKLYMENETQLGVSKPSIDLEALEQEAQREKEGMKQ